MIKKVLATGAVAASILGLGATQAMAIGDAGTTSINGNGASQSFGNAETHGDGSPQFGLVQGSLNKPCIGLLYQGQRRFAARSHPDRGPGHQRPVLAAEPAVHRELHPGQG